MQHISGHLSFGTDGIRGNASMPPFDHVSLVALGRAIACWAQSKKTDGQPVRIVIGSDTRLSGPRIKNSFLGGMRMLAVDIFDGGILPTPAICALVAQSSTFDCGIVISASHNPFYDNGIKVFWGPELKIAPTDEQQISQLAQDYLAREHDLEKTTVTLFPEAARLYQSFLLKACHGINFRGARIVIDCAHGAMSLVAPAVFKALGAELVVIHDKPDGTNINNACGATHPQSLATAVREHKALVGFAFDGDGDRVIASDAQGTIKDGDDILALLLTHDDFKNSTTVVATQMTNQGFEHYVKLQGKELIRTLVGDKYVAAALSSNGLMLGGEISGHTIIRSYLPSSDGLFVAIKALDTIIKTHNFSFKTFDKYPQYLLNMPVAQKLPLNAAPCSTLIETAEKQLLGRGRLLVRYSGTENLLRIMAEADSRELAQEVVCLLGEELKKILGATVTGDDNALAKN